jgi:hypothetical protein
VAHDAVLREIRGLDPVKDHQRIAFLTSLHERHPTYPNGHTIEELSASTDGRRLALSTLPGGIDTGVLSYAHTACQDLTSP